MLDERIDKLAIDAAAEKFGMPMVPSELADQVGLDICLAVGDMLRSKFGDLLPPTPAWPREKVAKGEPGRKTGKGFYIWKGGKPDKSSRLLRHPVQPTGEMIDRLVLPILECLRRRLRGGHRRQSRHGRWRDDLWHWLRAVPRRPAELRADTVGWTKRGLEPCARWRKIRWPFCPRCRLG